MIDLRAYARGAAQRNGIDPDIFERQIQQESGFNVRARSGAGAQGIAQFMPGTAKQYGVDVNDPKSSLDGAARLMSDALKRTGGDYKAALSVYNSGRPDGYKHIAETRNYVATIMGGSAPKVRAAQTSTSGAVTSGAAVAPAGPGFTKADVLKNYVLNRGKPGALAGLSTGLATLAAAPKVAKVATANSQGATANSPALGSPGDTKVLELFWQGPGGINVKNGKKVPQGFVDGHQDHVHVAAGPHTIIKLGKIAQSMGLSVGENPHFGTVHPVHVANSYHYKGEAIDVSGDPSRMAAFAHRVAGLSGAR